MTRKVKLHSAFHGEGAYEAFKKIASEFYKDHTYKFVGLTLDEAPTPDGVEFTAEFWRVSGDSVSPNAPLTLEELREMDGEPVWCINGNNGQWGLVHVFSAEGETYVECVTKTGFTMDKMTYGAMGIYAWLAYRRKPEEGTL